MPEKRSYRQLGIGQIPDDDKRASPALSEGNLEFANHLLGTSVRLQVEHNN